MEEASQVMWVIFLSARYGFMYGALDFNNDICFIIDGFLEG